MKNHSENVLLPYFPEQFKRYKLSKLWSHFSMLKANIFVEHKIDIGKFSLLIVLIKQYVNGYKAKKSSILTKK